MKKPIIVIIAVVALFAIAGAIYWHEININPVINIPPPPNRQAQNAADYFRAAKALDRDSVKWNMAIADRPVGYKDPNDPDHRYYSLAEQKSLLAENQPMIAKIRQGLAYPYVPVKNNDPISFASMPLREHARLLGFAAKVYGEEGDWNNAMTCDLDAMQFGTKISQHGTQIDRLMDIACEYIGRKHAWDTIDHLNSTQAKSAARRLESIDQSQYPLSLTVENDKWVMLGLLNGVFHAPGRDGTVLSFANMISEGGPSFRDYLLAVRTSKREVVAGYTQFMDQSAERCRHSFGVAKRLPPVPLPSSSVTRRFVTPLDRFQFKDAENQTQNDLLIVELGLRAYKLDHGRYPTSLSLLVPAYLKTVPIDPFDPSGQQLHYKLSGASYLLYSVGPDGKDDGGKAIYTTKWPDGSPITGKPPTYLVNEDSKGDIVAGVNIE